MIETERSPGLKRLRTNSHPREGSAVKLLCDIRLRRVILDSQFRIVHKAIPSADENSSQDGVHTDSSPRLPSRETLQRLLSNHIPQTEIARQYGVNQVKISRLKTKYGIVTSNSKKYPPIEVEDWVRVVHRYFHVHNYEVVARQLHFSRYDVEELLHKFNVMQTSTEMIARLVNKRKNRKFPSEKPILTERYYSIVSVLADELPSAGWIARALNLREAEIQEYLHSVGKIQPRPKAATLALQWRSLQHHITATHGAFSTELPEYRHLLDFISDNGNEITVSQLRALSTYSPRLRFHEMVIDLFNKGVEIL